MKTSTTETWQRLLAGASVVALAIGLATAIRVELLNARAGGALPASELRADGSPTQWRVVPGTTEPTWRKVWGPRDEAGNPVTRPLTDAEVAQMNADIRRSTARNDLRTLVMTWGMGQYLLVPLGMTCALFWLWHVGRHRPRAVAAACVVLCFVLLAVHTWWRAYWWSLGV